VPVNQLIMVKLALNSALLQQGVATSRMVSTVFRRCCPAHARGATHSSPTRWSTASARRSSTATNRSVTTAGALPRCNAMPKSLARMTARSVVLSVLLGAHPAWASAAELIRLTSDFGIKESTLRVALTRMVSAGDLVRSADGYRLADRLLARQRRQDDAMRPPLRPWRGYWTTLIVTSIGTDARTRAALRTTMHHKRFGELREGVWMRPDNLELELADEDRARVRIVQARDDEPAQLAGPAMGSLVVGSHRSPVTRRHVGRHGCSRWFRGGRRDGAPCVD